MATESNLCEGGVETLGALVIANIVGLMHTAFCGV